MALAVPGAAVLLALGLAICSSTPAADAKKARAPQRDARLRGAYRFERAGCVYVHLEGASSTLGFRHGYLLAPEIESAFRAVKLGMTHSTKRDWEFFRKASRQMLWPRIDAEYQEELAGIAAGLQARGMKFDVDDVITLNAFQEMPYYYVPWLNRREKVASAPRLAAPGNCSAFVAAGSYTRGSQIVMAHNAWTNYLEGEHWRIVFDVVPEKGNRFFMDGYPGVIASNDDFGVNSAGLMITETTISRFNGWNPDGRAEFVRARQAMQYAQSIDDYVRIMLDGNNGGYANDWLLADLKTGEIARFELGLKHYGLEKTKDGYFVGSNFASDPKVLAEETDFDPMNPELSPNGRRARWLQLMEENKGRIDAAMAERFLGDHYDSYLKKEIPNERSLCGHLDLSARGETVWDSPPYSPDGAVQGKVMDARMAEALSFRARYGHPCGKDFFAAQFLKAHPEFSWQAGVLEDMKASPWTLFRTGERK
ncbi:MAG: peptidase C45 [Acidobacteria bacterium]|nr:peptidase C45 [Acidobacteriota bacterium]